MDLTKINKIAQGAESLPLKKMSDLEVLKYYQITGLQRVKPQYSYIVTDAEENFSMYLPAHVAQALNDDPDYFQKMAQAAEGNRLQMRCTGNKKLEFNMVATDNHEDEVKKLAIKCPKPQPPNQPGPSVDVRRNTLDLTEINKIARGPGSLPLKKMSDLKVLKDYQITYFRIEMTGPGDGIAVEVDEAYEVFLPIQVAKALNNDGDLLLKMVQAAVENRLQMRYLGNKQIEFIDNPKDELKKLPGKWPRQSRNQPKSSYDRECFKKASQEKMWNDYPFCG